MNGNCAILYFAYRPEKEAIRKPLLPHASVKTNTRIYKELQNQLFKQVAVLGLPIIHHHDRQQEGNGFAERLCNAIESSFAQGFDRLIILGNDTPGLHKNIYQNTLDLIESGKSVLASTQKGGAAIIAITQAQYSREHWLSIDWQSSATFSELSKRLSQSEIIAESIIELHKRSDIQSYILSNPIADSLFYFLWNLVSEKPDLASKCRSFWTIEKFNINGLRAPPLSIS